MQGILEFDIVLGSGVGHGTPDFDALSERSKYRRESQSTVAGPPSCASVARRRRPGKAVCTMYRGPINCLDVATMPGISNLAHSLLSRVYRN